MRILIVAPLALIAACNGNNCPPQPIKYVTQKETVEVQRPCEVTIPKRPAALVVKPGDDARAIDLRQKAKLDEWGGPGESYANLAEAAIRACQEGGAD